MKIQLTKLSIVSFIVIFPLYFVLGQNEQKELWSNEPFGAFDLGSELLDLRDQHAKHFQNDNGLLLLG